MKKILTLPLYIFMFLLGCSPSVQAQAQTCVTTYSLVTKPVTLSAPAILVPPNFPVGGVLYEANIYSGRDPYPDGAIECYIAYNSSFVLDHLAKLRSGNLVPGSDSIYATNLPGVGVRIYNGVELGDVTTPMTTTTGVLAVRRSYPVYGGACVYTNAYCRIATLRSFKFEIIKTGEITPGVLLGSSFPVMSSYVIAASSNVTVSGNGEVTRTQIGGSLNITTGTCSTPPSFTVNLGTYSTVALEDIDATEWVDSSIVLTGCPSFTGMPTAGNWYYGYNYGANNEPYTNNIVTVNFQPINPIRVGVENAFLADQTPLSATGLDIQINRGTTASSSPISLNQQLEHIIPLGTTGAVSIPLVARMKKNGEEISPGEIKGKVVYLIGYK